MTHSVLARDANADGPMRLVLVHSGAPPSPGGTSLVVERVLSDMPEVALDVWTRATQWRAVRKGAFVLPAHYRYVPKVRALPRGPLPLAWAATAVNLVLAVAAGAVIGRAARRDAARWILSVVDEGFSQIAASIAARVAGVPHVIWVFDVWEENAYARSDRQVARWLERRVWRSAAALVVHGEELSAHYERKHGVPARVIRTPIRPPRAEAAKPTRDEAPFEVLVAGSVYWAQSEAVRRVARAVALVDGARLTIVGDASLQTDPIEGANYEPGLPPDRLADRLARADLLVLALSFEAPYPTVIQTATPARLPEYLASGVPLLVHAPAGSHAAEYVRRSEFGAVVDRPDTAAIVAAIEAVRDDPTAARRRAERARARALSDHDVVHVRHEFAATLRSLAGN